MNFKTSSKAVYPAILLAALAISARPARADVGLNITATFLSSITSDPNAAAIEATINAAISFYTSTFTTHTGAPIGVTIEFGEMTTGLGSSTTGVYKAQYQDVINQMVADSSGDPTDTTALAFLPKGATNPVTGSATINGKSANLRALGFSGATGIVDGTFDGRIGLNTHLTNVGSPGSSLQYSLLAVTEHEIDEVLGLGSDVGGTGFFGDPALEDLFRYDSVGGRSYAPNACSAPPTAFFSLNGTTDLAQFNNCNNGGDYGDWQSSPLPGGVNPKVQDAFATPFSTPFLTSTSPESMALDAMGYNLAKSTSPVPEPTSVLLLGSLVAITGFAVRRRAARRS